MLNRLRRLSVNIILLIIISCLVFFAPAAFAKTVKLTPHIDTWTLYTFGNGDIIAGILFGLQSLVKSKIFVNLINLMMLMGFGSLILSHITEGKLLLTSTVKYFLLTAILLRMLFGLTISVGLIDSVNPQHDQVISDVPFLMGAPASFLSGFGHIVAAQLDEAYSQHAGLPLSLTMTGGNREGASGAPFSIVAQMLMDGAHYSIEDPSLKDSLTHFMVDCVTPLIGSGYLSTHQLLTSDNLWGLLEVSHINPAIMTVYYDHNEPSFLGLVVTCRHGYELLNRDLQVEKPNFVSKWGQDITTGAAASLFQTVLTYTARESHYAPTPASYLQQAAMLSIFQGPSLNLMAMQSHSPLLMQRLSMQQAIQSAQTSWTTTAAIFQATFGYLYAALQVLVYAMAPMVMALMVFPGLRVLIMKRYLQLLAWFPVTLILLAVTNDILVYWSAQTLSQVWRDHSGLSMVGAPFVSARAANMAAVGAWLMTLVPMIAWGLVAGFNIAMNNLLNSVGTQTLASSAATQMVTGNVALNNQAYDNLTANKFSSLMKTDIGAMPTSSYGAGTSINEEDNLGGLSVLKNSSHAMHSKQVTRQTIRTQYAADSQSATDQKSLSHTAESSESASASAEAINRTTSRLHAGIKGGAIAGAASAYLQKVLADKNYHAVDNATVGQVADDIQTATLASADADDAQEKGDSQQAEGFVQKSKAALDHAFHALNDKLGGSAQGAVAAGTLLGGVLGKVVSATGLGAKLFSAFKVDAEGGFSLDTEAMHSNRVDAVASNRKTRQAGEQSLASAESRVGSQTAVTETVTENLSSERPGDDYAKASDIDIAGPVDAAEGMMDQKRQEIQNKTHDVQNRGDTLRQEVRENLAANAQTTQAKSLLDFKSTPAAKRVYKTPIDE